MVGFFNPFDSVDNAKLNKDVEASLASQAKFTQTATPQQAQAVAQIYKNSPWVPASVILALAKGNASTQATDAIAGVAGKNYVTTNTPNKPQKQSWFERNVYGKVKAASRYAFAALQFTPDLAQNIASQAFSNNDPAGVDGWFKSTQLGTMVSGENAGQGFFFGGEAAENQSQRARDFRGTINGHAWTIGRGAADIVFTPGSREYSLLSGFIDGAVNIYADPTMYAGQALKAARTVSATELAEEGTKGIKGLYGTKTATKALAKQLVDRGIVTSEVLPGITKAEAASAAKVARGAAGLTSAESAAFRDSDFFKWFDKSKPAQRFAERFAGYAKSASDNIAAKGLTGEAAETERRLAAFKIMEDMPEGSITPDVAMMFANADDPLKVKATLGSLSTLGIPAEDMRGLKNITDVRGSTIGQYIKEQVPVYRNLRNSRFFSEIPNESLIRTTTGIDRTKTVYTLSKYMKAMGIHTTSPGAYDNIMAEAMKVMSDPNTATRRTKTEELFLGFLDTITDHVGGDKSISKAAYEKVKEDIANMRAFANDAAGQPMDGGAFAMLREYLPEEQLKRLEEKFSPEELNRLQFNDAAALVQMIDDMHVLPDFRSFRARSTNTFTNRALKKMGFDGKTFLRNKEGETNAVLGAVEQFQQEVWKPAVLATGGFIVRNMIDSHIRIAASGYQGFFSHPFQFMQTMLGNRFIGALSQAENGRAKVFEDIGEQFATQYSTDILDDYAASTSSNVYRNIQDPYNANRTLIRNEHFGLVNRGNDQTAHTVGYIDGMGAIATDPIMSLLARYWHLGPEERIARVNEFLESPDGTKARKWILDHYKNGRRVADPQTGKHIFLDDLGDLTDAQRLSNWVERQASAEVSNILRGNLQEGVIDADLQFIVGHDRVPLMENIGGGTSGLPADEVRIAPRETQRLDTVTYAPTSRGRGVGATVEMGLTPDGKVKEGIITRIDTVEVPDPFNPGSTIPLEQAEIQPVAPGSAFTKREKDPALLGTKALREHIDYKGNQNQLAQIVRRANRVEAGKTGGLDKISKMMDMGVKWFFNGLVGTAQHKMERSPLWRQAFYKEVASNAKLLSEAEQSTLRANIDRYVEMLNADLEEAGKAANVTAEKYVGNEEIYNKIFGTVARGDGTVAELEQHAGAFATSELQRILYDAHRKSNLEDMLRVVAPFATAFRETLGKYTDYLLEDPSRIRKTQLAYDAVNYDNDPDNAFAGWFGRDPLNNTSMFHFPVGGWAGPLLAFPMKGAFQVANLPGVGPVAQIAASELLPDTPKLDFVRKMILPYGEQTVGGLVPGWARRGYEAIKADETNMATVYGNTYAETVKYHSSSGNYDMTDPNEVAKMYADSRRQAQILSGIRALFQFTGPTSPQVDFRVETEGGDVIASTIAQAYYDLQAENPDTAVQEFIKKFGENAFSYLGHKTEAIAGGLETSQAFGDWARNNSELMEQYKKTAGYFAPGGDDFSFETYNRQLQRGERRRLSAAEMVAGAQKRIGMSIYREKRNMLGDKLSTDQRDWLNQWRVYLNSKYPGFPVKPDFNPGEFENTISELKDIVQDDRLKDNDVASAVSQYLVARDKALAKAGSNNLKSLSSDKAQPLRDWLGSIAQVLVQQTPEFSRIFEDKLAAEVD
jgi:hypothetical protein